MPCHDEAVSEDPPVEPAHVGAPVASIVIPAHNEERTIARCLRAILFDARPGEFEVIVVPNGCSDRTAEVARALRAGIRVIEIATASKQSALRAGDETTTCLPRVYVDADVEIDTASLRLLLAPLADGAVHATAPERILPRDGVAPLVRWYYDVWERLPQVRAGLFGRGVIALSAVGWEQVRALPPAMSDDLVISEAFAAHERQVVPGTRVVIRPPRTVRDLIRRRTRVATGNAQADATGRRSADATTSLGGLARLVVAEPRLALRLPVFLSIAAWARLAACRPVRSGDFQTWPRDESSRAPSPPGAAVQP